MKKGKDFFSSDEDRLLVELVNKFGSSQWKTIAWYLPKRTSRQCRERYKHYLSPSLNFSPWSMEEDELLLAKVRKLGNQWSLISKYFTNRTDIHIKNRYKALTIKEKKSSRRSTIIARDHDHIREEHYEDECKEESSEEEKMSTETLGKIENQPQSVFFDLPTMDEDLEIFANLFDLNGIFENKEDYTSSL